MDSLELPELRSINDYQVDKSRNTMERHSSTVTPAKALGSDETVLLYEYSEDIVLNANIFGPFKIGVATLCYMDSEAVGENNVRLLGFVSRGETKLLVVEDLGNDSLEGLIKNEEFLTLEMIKDIAYQVARALEVYSDLKIPHHGVHPSNIFLKDGTWILGPPFPLPITDEIEISETNFKYSAPETPFGSRSTFEGDMWSYGVLLTQLLEKLKFRETAPSEIIPIEVNEEGFLWRLMKRRVSTTTFVLNMTLPRLADQCKQEKIPLRWSAHKVVRCSVNPSNLAFFQAKGF